MAPVAATLDISFISNFAGQHRICWAISPSTTYDCTTLVICLGGGATCSASIPITVDNQTCETVTYWGYVQAACEDPASLNGRLPFSITFIPNTTCAMYSITCENAEGCPEVTTPAAGIDCSSTSIPTLPASPLNTIAKCCSPAVPVATGWVVALETDCCFTCTSITFTNGHELNTYYGYYTNCVTGEITPISCPPGTTIVNCGVTNSGFTFNASVTITYGFACIVP